MKEGRQETTNVGGTTAEPHLVFLLAATEWASLVPRRLWGEVLLPPTNTRLLNERACFVNVF